MNEAKLYLKLFHGRASLDQDMDDWGSEGPIFGPLAFVHTTYRDTIHLGFEGENGDAQDLDVVGDCVYYDGVYYGDWSAFISNEPQSVSRYEPTKASLPAPEAEPTTDDEEGQ